MKLIREMESKRDKKGKLVKWAVFYCAFCDKENRKEDNV